MPWGIDDVDKHHKGLSDHQKKVWVAVANSVLSKTGDDGSAIRQANSAANRAGISEGFETVLYAKAADLIEAIRLQEAANFWGALHESDPKPRVEKDIKGRPVIPTDDQYREYFDGMNAAHIETMLNSARSRWSAAASDAEKKAIKLEIKVGQEVLKAKKEGGETAPTDKRKLARYKAIHTSIKQIAGKNPFLHMIAKHVADNYISGKGESE
jgi:hypothetical protein